MSGHLFVFFNRKKDKIKILHWERSGFVIFGKYLEQDRFSVPKSKGEIMNITVEQLNWLLDGVDINLIKPHPERKYDLVG
jgi:transposase